MHDTIHKVKHEAGHDFHFFSGINHELGKRIQHTLHRGDIFNSPAHISGTHSLDIAQGFAMSSGSINDKGRGDLIHIHIKPKDKIVHLSSVSYTPSEHESLLPSGTNLQYHGSSIDHDKSINTHFTTHHFTIHSQD